MKRKKFVTNINRYHGKAQEIARELVNEYKEDKGGALVCLTISNDVFFYFWESALNACPTQEHEKKHLEEMKKLLNARLKHLGLIVVNRLG